MVSPTGFTLVTITSVVVGRTSLVVDTSTKRVVLAPGDELVLDVALVVIDVMVELDGFEAAMELAPVVLPALNVVETPLVSAVVSSGIFDVVTTSTVVSLTVVVVRAVEE